MRAYLAYGLILIIIAGVAFAWRLSRARRRRDHESIRYRIIPRDDDEGVP